MNYVRIGKIVNTHGIKGELRLISDFKYKNKVFKPDIPIYIGKEKKREVIASYRPHKNFDMITLKGYDNINEVLKYKGELAYVNRDDLQLSENEYLDEDLIGLKVYSNDIYRGIIKRINKDCRNYLLEIENDHNVYFIPDHESFIKEILWEEKKIIINYMKGLFNDEEK